MTGHVAETVSDARSFIIRLWWEGDRGRSGHWRGQVVCVPAGKRVFAASANELPTLLAGELGRAGIRLDWSWRLRVRLHRWRRALRGQA